MGSLIKLCTSKILSNLMLLQGKITWPNGMNRFELPNGKIMCFNPKDRVQVYGYVVTVWNYNVYGEVPKGGFIVDAGASIGTYTLKVADDVSSVLAIEPEPRIYNRLLNNIKLNKIDNVIPMNIALSSYDGTSDFYLTHQLFGQGHEISPRHKMEVCFPVKCLKLDTVMSAYPKVDEINMVKIDIEGHEPQMLLGARQLLTDGVIENFSIAVYHYKNEEDIVRNILKAYGYATSSKFFIDGDIILYAHLKR